MTAPTAAPASTVSAPPAPAVESLEVSLALRTIEMDAVLARAAVEADMRAALHGVEEAQLPNVHQDEERLLIAVPPHSVPLCPYGPRLARTLWTAARHIERHGHARGALRDEQGATCALGALRSAADGDCGHEADAAALMLDTIRRRLGDRFETVPQFNDDPTTAPRAVVRFLDEAAYRAS